MERMLPLNHKRAQKHPKNKKRQPLKVVYITNPIKFNTSASQFRALVQELTGQDADTPESAGFLVDSGVGGGLGGGGGAAAEVVKVAAKDNVHAVEEEVTKIGHPSNGEVVQQGSDPSAIGSYDDVFVSPQMIENFQGLEGSNYLVDVLKSQDAM